MAKKNTVEIILAAKDQASKITKKAFDSVQSSAQTALKTVRTASKLAIGALTGLSLVSGKMGIDFNAAMEQSQIAWETLLGSADKAKKTVQELLKLGANTPFEFEGLDKSAKLLNMAGFQGDKLTKTLTAVGDAVSAVGGGQDELEGVSMALFQMSAKGKISAEEMNQLAERGIPAWDIMAKKMGVSTRELMNMSQKGQLMADDVIPLLVDGMGEQFGGAMKKQSQTFTGMMSKLKDNVKMFLGQAMEPAFERIKKFLPTVIGLVNRISDAFSKGGWSGVFKELLPESAFQFIVTAFGIISNAFNKVKDTFVQNKDKISGVFETIKGAILGYVGYVKNLFSGDGNLGQSFAKIFGAIKSIASPILQDAISFIKSIIGQIKTFWDENGVQIVQAIKNVWSIIAGIIQFIAPVILFIIKMLWDNVKGVIQGALNIIMGLIKIFAGLFTGDFGKMWEGIKQLFIGAVEAVWNLINLMMFGRILGGIKAFITKGITSFTEFWTKAVEVFKNLDTNIWNIVSGFVSKIVGILRGFYQQGASIFGTLKAFGESTFRALGTAIKSVASSIYNAVISHFTNMYTGAKLQFEGIWSTAKSIFGKLKSAITNPIDTAKESIRKSINAIKSIFSNMKVKIPLPHFSVGIKHKSIGGVSVPYPDLDVDWYDKGGIFNKPSVIGVGEKRPEFVGALDDLEQIVRKSIREEKDNSPISSVSLPEYAVINIDGRQVMLATIDYFLDEADRRKYRKKIFEG